MCHFDPGFGFIFFLDGIAQADILILDGFPFLAIAQGFIAV
jgi:hypothetical protein